MSNALLVVDVQRDYVEGGALPVPGGQQVADNLASSVIPVFDLMGHLVLFTADWHIDPGSHFSDNPDYETSWPPHCVAGTPGAMLASSMIDETNKQDVQERVFLKGQYSEGHSGIEGQNFKGTSIVETMQYFGVDTVDIVGISYDFGIKATALDLIEEGFTVNVIKDFTVSIHPENDNKTTRELSEAGVNVYDGREWAREKHSNG